MSYKLRKMKWIAKNHGKELNRVNELFEKLIETHGSGTNWCDVDTPEMTEYMKLIDGTIEEIRDYYVCTEKLASRYFFDALRLRQRNKI